MFELIEIGRRNEIGLVKQDHVGKGDLFLGFAHVVEVLDDMSGINDGDDGVELQVRLHLLVGEKRLRYRAGVGQSGRLDQDVVELVLALEELAEDTDEIAADGAADAAVVHLEDFFLGLDHQILIDADLAELVLDNGDALAVLRGQNVVEKRGLASSEKAGQDGDRDTGVIRHVEVLFVERDSSCNHSMRRQQPKKPRSRVEKT